MCGCERENRDFCVYILIRNFPFKKEREREREGKYEEREGEGILFDYIRKINL